MKYIVMIALAMIGITMPCSAGEDMVLKELERLGMPATYAAFVNYESIVNAAMEKSSERQDAINKISEQLNQLEKESKEIVNSQKLLDIDDIAKLMVILEKRERLKSDSEHEQQTGIWDLIHANLNGHKLIIFALMEENEDLRERLLTLEKKLGAGK